MQKILKNNYGYRKDRKIFACVMAVVMGISGIFSVDGHAAENQGETQEYQIVGRTAEVTNIRVQRKKSYIDWTPVMDVSDKEMKNYFNFLAEDNNAQVNDLVGDNYTIQWFQDGSLLSDIPKNAGEYTVKIILDESLKETARLVSGGDTFEFTIKKMDLSSALLGFYYTAAAKWTGDKVMPENPYVENSSYRMPEDTYELSFIEGKNCTEVGTGYVRMTGKGPNVEGQKEFTYNISKVNMDAASVKIQTEYVYDGTGKMPIVEELGDEISEYSYVTYWEAYESPYGDIRYLKLSEMPSDVGNYRCYMSFIPKDTDHYNKLYTYFYYTITPLKLEASVQVETSKVYDTGVSAKTSDVIIKNSVEGDDVRLYATAKYDSRYAGTGKSITVSFTMSGNDVKKYTIPDSFVITDGEITPKEVEVANVVLQSYYYNGSSEIPLDETSITDKNHWTLVGCYSSVDDIELDKSDVKAYMDNPDAGNNKPVTFTGFKLKGADADNYSLLPFNTTVTIRRKEFSNAYMVSMPDYLYGSEVPEPTLAYYEGDGEITYKYRKKGSDEEYTEWKNIQPYTLKPGAYEMIADITDTINYKGGTTVYAGGFNVIKFSPELNGTEYMEKKYGDGPFLLDITSKGDASLQYSVFDGEDVVTVDEDGRVSIKKAGEARILVKSAETELYRYENILVTISVAKINGSAQVSIEDWVYSPDNRNVKSPVPKSETNGTDNVSYLYKLRDDDTDWTKEIPINSGKYTVKAIFAETENYQEITAMADFEIFKEKKPENMPAESTVKTEAAGTMEKLKDITLPEGWLWKNEDIELIPGGIITAEAVYEDTLNYEEYELKYEITKAAEIITAATDYEYIIGVDNKAVIKCTGALSVFNYVETDGEIVAPSNYILEEGSTVITFKEDWLNTLSVGSHKIILSYKAGDVETILLVSEKEEETGITSDKDNKEENKKEDKAENKAENKAEDKIDEAVKTGDSSSTGIWLWSLTMVIIASLLGLCVLKLRYFEKLC